MEDGCSDQNFHPILKMGILFDFLKADERIQGCNLRTF
jgi:hypothetical protein